MTQQRLGGTGRAVSKGQAGASDKGDMQTAAEKREGPTDGKHNEGRRRRGDSQKSRGSSYRRSSRDGGGSGTGRKRQKKLVGVRVESTCMVYRLLVNRPRYRAGDQVLLETTQGEKVGQVIFVRPLERGPERHKATFPGRIKRIIRRLTSKDLEMIGQLQQKEREAFLFCRDKVKELGLDMRLSKVSYLLGGHKAIFYFTAEQRVDFRELVRTLANRLRLRVEMRQIGVRDETRLLGGMGPCGQQFCCAQHLRKFHPVSVRMAKNQDLSLNPDVISGVCGRLMCCLAFEDEVYTEKRSGMPRPNARAWTKSGDEVRVCCIHPLKESIEVRYASGDQATFRKGELFRMPPGEHDVEDQRPATSKRGSNDTQSDRGQTRKASGHIEEASRTESLEDSKKGGRKRRRKGKHPQVTASKPDHHEKKTQNAEQQAADGRIGGQKKKRRRKRRNEAGEPGSKVHKEQGQQMIARGASAAAGSEPKGSETGTSSERSSQPQQKSHNKEATQDGRIKRSRRRRKNRRGRRRKSASGATVRQSGKGP